jgi:hypothetical protein
VFYILGPDAGPGTPAREIEDYASARASRIMGAWPDEPEFPQKL